jgi:hypothetical protein
MTVRFLVALLACYSHCCICKAVLTREQLASLVPRLAETNATLLSGDDGDIILHRKIDLHAESFGNLLGRYVEAVACCDIVGMHFINTGTIERGPLFGGFPQIMVHNSPTKSIRDATQAMREVCPNEKFYPWKYSGAWDRRIGFIHRLLASVVQDTLTAVGRRNITASSFATITKGLGSVGQESLPLVPGAALVLRCADILRFGKSAYGFLNFNVYAEFIPGNVQTIYILSEELDYLNAGRAHGIKRNCEAISLELMRHLAVKFPSAIIGIRRGHMVEHFLMLALAETVVCPPSSFGFYAGLANLHQVYFQASTLITSRPFIRDSFHWIASPEALYFGGALSNNTQPDSPQALNEIIDRLTAPTTVVLESTNSLSTTCK